MAAARSRGELVPEEALSGAEALGLYTHGAARALDEPAPLQPGSPADFTVLDRDPVEVGPGELRDTKVLATWVDGESVEFPKEPPVW